VLILESTSEKVSSLVLLEKQELSRDKINDEEI
jgi:hypothetical protein